QTLVALDMNLSSIQREAKQLSPEALKTCSESLELVKALSREVRTISHLLHPPLLDEAGLPSALRWYVEGFAERSKIAVDLQLSSELGRLSPEMETTLFRIVQEGLTNIHRHSSSPDARISLDRSAQEVTLEICDHGKGMRSPDGSHTSRPVRPGVGIQGMRERVRQLGGRLEIQSSSKGTTIRAILPVKEQPSEVVEIPSSATVSVRTA